VDVADSSAVATMFDQLKQKTERLDLMVHCSAILGGSSFVEDIQDQKWHRVMSINLEGTFFCCREVVRWMKGTGGGRIVLFSSISSLRPVPGNVLYGITKAGVNMLTKTLAVETAQHNIRVNAIAPGYVNTPMLKGLSEDRVEWALENTPLHRMAIPEEIAGVVSFLASPDADFFTGQILSPNGGPFYLK